MKKLFKLILSITVLMAFQGCKKEAGPGGNANLNGNIYKNLYCSETGLITKTEGAVGSRVYITYGDGSQFDNSERSGVGGSYKFRFLNPGNYTITVISECDTCIGGESVVKEKVEIGKNDEDVNVTPIYIDDFSNGYCEGAGEGGSSTVTGTLEAIFVDENNLDTLSTQPLLDERVYLIYGEDNTHDDDVRSSADGTFQFKELRKGTYRLYAYSECLFCANGIEPTYLNFEILEDQSIVELPSLKVIIYK